MLVIYNGVNVHTINHARGSVRFIPGVNDVSETDLKAISEHPAFIHLTDEGIIARMNIDSPKGLPTTRAIALIKKTVDEDLLQRWRSAESRRTDIIQAIDAQLKAITFVPGESDKDDEDAAETARRAIANSGIN